MTKVLVLLVVVFSICGTMAAQYRIIKVSGGRPIPMKKAIEKSDAPAGRMFLSVDTLQALLDLKRGTTTTTMAPTLVGSITGTITGTNTPGTTATATTTGTDVVVHLVPCEQMTVLVCMELVDNRSSSPVVE
ncbi:unnamed protein product [Hermetia illucens]|uniref:Uncharacterized protein n=1 Tax=Hermetia illucens TaxID=343691 RepID=A0A7R8YYX2_HERIL|nr:unnamed protein product [Hermetia illucens]